MLPTYLCNSQLKLLGSSIPTYSYLYVRKSAVVYLWVVAIKQTFVAFLSFVTEILKWRLDQLILSSIRCLADAFSKANIFWSFDLSEHQSFACQSTRGRCDESPFEVVA